MADLVTEAANADASCDWVAVVPGQRTCSGHREQSRAAQCIKDKDVLPLGFEVGRDREIARVGFLARMHLRDLDGHLLAVS